MSMKIILDGVTWSIKTTKSSVRVKNTITGKIKHITFSNLSKIPWDERDRSKFKGDYKITLRDIVRNWLKNSGENK